MEWNLLNEQTVVCMFRLERELENSQTVEPIACPSLTAYAPSLR